MERVLAGGRPPGRFSGARRLGGAPRLAFLDHKERLISGGIAGKIIVITGASSGLGEAAARHLAAQGATVVLGARRADRIEALATALTEAGLKAKAIVTDVVDRDQVKNLVDTAVAEFGRVDVMLNNAGLMPLAPLERLKIDEWDQMIDVNIKGVLYGVAAALPHMKAQKSGHIINVSSVYGHVVDPGATVYCATKFAVRALSEGLRKEVKPYNIRTTIVSPGAVSTELLEHISEKDIQEGTKEFVRTIAIGADTFARVVAFAVNEPDDVDVNEILFRPTAQPV
nr:SDR family oxidoreductase [uncultured Caulobacter sp.]